MVPDAVHAGDDREQADDDVSRAHPAALTLRGEPLVQPDKAGDDQGRADEDGDDGERGVRPDEQADA